MSLDTNTILALLAFLARSAAGSFCCWPSIRSNRDGGPLGSASNLFMAAGTVVLLEKRNIEIAFLCLVAVGALQWTAILKFNHRTIPLSALAPL